MNNCCDCHSETTRDGSGQLSRYLKALDPSYAPVDDRSIEELLVFAKRYANQIRFYDIPESHIEDGTEPAKISWREFFRRDMAVIAASVAAIDLEQFRKQYDELRANLEARPAHAIFSNLFDPILGMAAKIDGWYALAIPENPLYADIQLAINSNLKEQMQKIVAYEEGFKYVDSRHPLNLDYTAIENRGGWGLDGSTIDADISIYEGPEADDKIKNAALFVDDIFNSFYGFLSQLVDKSEGYMQFALEQYPSHQPHMALFIAFLQLFRLAQEQMNGITERMLDFYYRDVLHLEAKPSIPDKVHIVFELAKDIAEYDVAKDTALKAGKDASGLEQIYKTETDLVVNQAKVKELKNIFIEKTSLTASKTDGTDLKRQIIQKIYARPVANSKDGFGGKFTDPNLKWPTFGKGNPVMDDTKNACNQIALLDEFDQKAQAQIGFAIASPQLVLQGGNRLISCTLNALNKLFDNPERDVEIWLSAEDGWLKIDNNWFTPEKQKKFEDFIKSTNDKKVFNDSLDFESGYFFEGGDKNKLHIYLPIAAQAIIPFDVKLHTGYTYVTPYPVMQIMIGPNINIDDLERLNVNDLSLSVRVGSINEFITQDVNVTKVLPSHFDGLKTLTLQNDNGSIDIGKPFDPFTPIPFPGNSFYIGSNEVFNKPLGELAINIQHVMAGIDEAVDVASGASEENSELEIYKAYTREKKQWKSLSTKNGRNFTEGALTSNILFTKKTISGTEASTHEIERIPISYPTDLNQDTYKGFIQIENNLNFPRRDNKEVASSIAPTSDAFQLLSRIAPILKIKEISLSYSSDLQKFDPKIDQFFHIYPFGVVETYLNPPATIAKPETNFSVIDSAKDFLLVNANNVLLPKFNYLSPYSKYNKNSGIAPSETAAASDRSFFVNNRFENINSSLITRAGNSVVGRLILDAGNFREKREGYANQYSGNILQEGMLFIGLEKLKPLQSISMLFQFAEGSSENEDDDPPPINWSYLTYNEWRPLKAENLVSDGTYGFQTTGIIKIDVPADASSHNTIITDGLMWFCASVTENSNRIPQLIDVVTQAVEAKFNDQGNDQSHFDKALAVGSITKLEVPVAEVSKVLQPFASFDGKHMEIGKEFYTRVSERLRHKGRAINAWDYEHLVLDRFPSVYKVKCITHTDPNCLCRSKPLNRANKEAIPRLIPLPGPILPTVLPPLLPRRIMLDNSFAVMMATLNEIADEISKNNLLNITLVGYGANGSKNIKEIFDALRVGLPSIAIPIIHPVDPLRISSKIALNRDAGTVEFVDIIETETCCGPQVAPGHVLIIPIANLKNRNAANPLQPKTSRTTLIAIQEYLKTRTSPFVHVHAKNPVYEQIIVSFKVKFHTGTDKGFYMKKLNDEIVHFLTPWAFDEKAEVKFNQKIYASSIINFIEERPYVDFITDFIMGICCDDCCEGAPSKIGVGSVAGIVFVDEKKKPAPGVSVRIKGLERTAISGTDGKFIIPDIPPGSYTLLAQFSLFNTGYKDFTINPEGVVTPASIDFVQGGASNPDKITEFFNRFCGCNEIEFLLRGDPGFEGDIVAKPCTSRSILVSVPQHIIIPFEEPVQETPCEKRRLARLSIKPALGGAAPDMITKDIAVEPVDMTAFGHSEILKRKPQKKTSRSKKSK